MTPVVCAWLFLFLPGYKHVTFQCPTFPAPGHVHFLLHFAFQWNSQAGLFLYLSLPFSLHTPSHSKGMPYKVPSRKKGRIFSLFFSCGIFLLYFPSPNFCCILPTFLRNQLHVLSHILSFNCNKKVTKKLKLKYKNAKTK